MRVAVVDIGSNSTRLLIADVDSAGGIEEIVRRSQVTRLGSGVDAHGELSKEGIERVLATLAGFAREIEEHRCAANLAVLTSAVRDATNGAEFRDRVRDDFGLDARVLSGDEEAQLTFLGATSDQDARPSATAQADPGDADPAQADPAQADPARAGETGAQVDSEQADEAGAHTGADEPTVVIDVGGGSTEFVIGSGRSAGFHTSTQAGVVRMSERHIHHDPPLPQEIDAMRADTRAVFEAALPQAQRELVRAGIAVAGTATSAAAIEQRLDPYEPRRVHGYVLASAAVGELLERLAAIAEPERRKVPGLHPDRAPTIVAGMVLLGEAMRATGLSQVRVSEHDILWGGALRLAGYG